MRENSKQLERLQGYADPERGHYDIETETQDRAAKWRKSGRGEVPGRHPP